MWVLVSFGKIVGDSVKSESAIAKRLGISRQYLNKQLKKGKNHFMFRGMPVLVMRQMEFSAAGQEFETQNQMADALGLSRAAVARVFKTGKTGVVQTKGGKEVKVSRIAGSTFIPAYPKPLPAIRVMSEVGGREEFSSIAAASRELGIDSKTIPSALRSGRDSFTRKFDGMKFTVEIPGEEMSPQKQYDQELSKLNQACLQALREDNLEEVEEIAEKIKELEVLPRTQTRFCRRPVKMETYLKETPATEREEHVLQDAEKMAAWAEKNVEPPEEEEEKEEESPFLSKLWSIFSDLPKDSERDFNKNKHHIIPAGYQLKNFYEKEEEEKATKVLVVGPHFDWVVMEDIKEYWELDLMFPFHFSATKEAWESYPELGLLPLSVMSPDRGKEEWFWRVKIIQK